MERAVIFYLRLNVFWLKVALAAYETRCRIQELKKGKRNVEGA